MNDFQANRLGKFEVENQKLRERLIEFEFLKARVEELRMENSLLLETKQELEVELSSNANKFEGVIILEKEIKKFQHQLESISEVL